MTVAAPRALDRVSFAQRVCIALAPLLLAGGCAGASDATDDSPTVFAAAAVPGLVAAYGFEEGAGDSTADATGRGHTGVLRATSWISDGRYGRALSFNGTSSWVTIADASDLDLSNGMTLSAWVRPSRTLVRWPTIVMKEATGLMAYCLYAGSSTGNPSSYNVINGVEQGVHGGSTLPIGQWRHVAATFDGAKIILFIDGVQVGERAAAGTLATSAGPLRIGGTAVWADEFFAGTIDDVRIYNRALTAAEIGSDMGTPVVAGAAPAADAGATADAAARDAGVDAGRPAVDAGRDAGAPTTAVAFPLQRASSTARHLVDQNGKPFFMNGEAAWSIVINLTREQATTYLDDRKARGFNTLLVNLVEKKFGASAPRNAYGQGPFTTWGDFSTPNEAYFAHADWVLAEAAKRGMLVLLAPAYVGANGGSEGWYQEMLASGATKMRGYGRFLGERYRTRSNIVWVHGGDYNAPNKDIVRAVELGLEDAGAPQLRTAHGPRNSGAGEYWTNESWLDLDNTYSGLAVFQESLDTLRRAPRLPFFYIEGYYENENNVTEQQLREQIYVPVLLGAFGHVFGNNPIWLFGSGWPNALGSRGTRHVQHAFGLFAGRRWHTLVPDDPRTFVVSGYGTTSDPRAVGAVAADGSFAVVYVVGTSSVTLDLRKLRGPAQARWFDPTDGSYRAVAGSPLSNAGNATLSAPGTNGTGTADWVLVLEAP